MRTSLRLTVRILGALAALLVLALAAGWFATRGAYPVSRTVTDNPGLPHADLNGVQLHVRTFGDPSLPPVVVVHGGPGNDSRYLLPLAALQDRYYVVFYDQRGSGLSARVPDSRITLDAFYSDLDAIVDRYGAGRPVRLIGHSWGAMLASGYLGLHPEKISHVVLAEPGMLTSETAKQLMASTNGMMPRPSLQLLGVGAKVFLQSLHVDGPDADARADFLAFTLMTSRIDGHPTAGYFCNRDLATARMESWRFGARVGPALFAQAKGPDGAFVVDFTRGVERFPRKVLFLAGSCNTLIGEAMQRKHMVHFRQPELVVIPGAGHTMFGEKTEESLAAVRGYFAAEG